ncbi:hypothetical protein [Parasitella parasitica]|uniref:Uncharacterized protein n=1 Tax=Parasitella parasitica TaxID=35722 RepID=A0A0B7N7K3_9FUNG|nr:hypothetical protein [Parasitella parasitica]
MYFCFCAARFVWLWAIQPGLSKLVTCLVLSLPRLAWSLSSAAFSCCLALWPKKEPYALVLVPSFSIMMEPAALDVLPVSSSADSVPFERPFLRPVDAPSAPQTSVCALAASDVPVVAPSSVSWLVSAAPASGNVAAVHAAPPAVVPVAPPAVVPAALPVAQPAVVPAALPVALPAIVPAALSVALPAAVPAALPVALPAALPAALPTAVLAVSKVPAAPAVNNAPTCIAASDKPDALAKPVAEPSLPVVSVSAFLTAPRASFGRGIRFGLSSRGKDAARRRAARTQKKVGKTTPPCALRRAACAALAAGIVKPAPLCLPVVVAAASSLSAGVGSLLLASARTVEVARKPARRIVSVRRFLRPAVRRGIEQQKAAIVARGRAVAGRRRVVVARRAAAVVAAAAVAPRPAPAACAVSFCAPGPVWRPVAPPVCRPPSAVALAGLPVFRPPVAFAPASRDASVFAVPVVPSCVGRPPAALSVVRGPRRAGGSVSRPAGCSCPAVPAALARPVSCSCPAVAPFGRPPAAQARQQTINVYGEQKAAIARPAVAVYARPAPKAETPRQASGSPCAAPASSSNSSSSVSSRRIAIPRLRRPKGKEN